MIHLPGLGGGEGASGRWRGGGREANKREICRRGGGKIDFLAFFFCFRLPAQIKRVLLFSRLTHKCVNRGGLLAGLFATVPVSGQFATVAFNSAFSLVFLWVSSV